MFLSCWAAMEATVVLWLLNTVRLLPRDQTTFSFYFFLHFIIIFFDCQ